jgi:hypothetical protein
MIPAPGFNAPDPDRKSRAEIKQEIFRKLAARMRNSNSSQSARLIA